MSLVGSPAWSVNFSQMPVMIGFGCYFQGNWYQSKFPETHLQDGLMSINWKELYGITMALVMRGNFWGKRILVHCDNASVVQIMTKCSLRSKSMMVLVCSLVLFDMHNNFDLCLHHISGVNNGIANVLSWFNHDEFYWLTPGADLSMMLPVAFAYQ